VLAGENADHRNPAVGQPKAKTYVGAGCKSERVALAAADFLSWFFLPRVLLFLLTFLSLLASSFLSTNFNGFKKTKNPALVGGVRTPKKN